MHRGIRRKCLPKPFAVALNDRTAALTLIACQLQCQCGRSRQTECGRAAAVQRRAGTAVHLRFERHTAALEQHAAAADAAKLVRRKAQRVDAGKVHRNTADGLRCVNVQTAVRMVSQQRCDFVYRLNGAKLAVHRADGNENGIRTQKLAHFLRVNRAVPSDGEQVDLPAAFLQSGQATADRGMLERCGDDMLADMP